MSAPFGGHRVLIVEDDPETAEAVRALVVSRGDTPVVATTVLEALAGLATGPFCYAILDQQLPHEAGNTPLLGGGELVLTTLRAMDDRRPGGFYTTPIVVLTSYSGHEDFVSKMYDLGASAFMSKPLTGNTERLLDKIRVVLERAKRVPHAACADLVREIPAAGPDDEEEIKVPKLGGIAAQLGASTFSALAVKVTDGHTVRITHQRRRVHATYIDLGLATKSRVPTKEWNLFLDVCAGHGSFRWKSYGSINNAKQRVFVLRGKLKAAFGLEDEPFRKFTVAEGWRARFFASSELVDGR